MDKFFAIALGSVDTKLIKVEINKDTIILSNPMIIKTPQALIINNRIADSNSIVKLLKETISKMGKFIRNTVVLLDDSYIITREMELPEAKPKDIEQMVMTDAAGYLPSDVSEYTIRFKILTLSNTNQKKKNSKVPLPHNTAQQNINHIMMSSIKTDLVMDFYDVFRKSGLNPVAIDTSINGMMKFFKRYLQSLYGATWIEKSYVFLSIEASNAKLLIMKKGILVLQQILSYSSQMIDVLISNSLNISIEDAEKYKIQYGIEYLYSIPDDPLCAKVGVVINSQLDILLTDIYHYIDDYNYKNPQDQVTNIWVTGGVSKMKGLCRYITEAFSIPCELVRTNNLIKFSESYNQSDSTSREKNEDFYPSFTNLIGATIRGA